MYLNTKNAFLKLVIIFFLMIITLSSCGIYKKSDARKVSPNADERVKQNIAEGKGIKLGNFGGTGKVGDFQFASANELWRAALEVLDFLPLSNVDYSGGIIITDWYSENLSNKESIKITVRFLSNEIRADGLDIIIHKKICNDFQNCSINKYKSSIEDEIKLAILKKAAVMEKIGLEKYMKELKKRQGSAKSSKRALPGTGEKD